jgi:phage shock protein A
MEYQTRMATEVRQWAARLNAHVPGVSRSRPVASAQYWLLAMIGSWATGPGLEAAHQRLLLTLSRARRASADVATSRKRLELQISELERQANETEAPGGQAMDASQVDAAGQDQTTRDVTGQLTGLRLRYADMQVKEQRVHAANRRLFAEVNAFRTSKDAIKAAYTAAEEAAKAVSAAASGDRLAQDDATGEGAEPR